MRDLSTVSIDHPYLASGLLRMEARDLEAASSEEHFVHKRFGAAPRCVAIDPLFRWLASGRIARAAWRAADLSAAMPVSPCSLRACSRHRPAPRDDHAARFDDLGLVDQILRSDGEPSRALSIIKSRGSSTQSAPRAGLHRQWHHTRRPLHGRGKPSWALCGSRKTR